MKIAITAQEPNLEASVDPRFGRCRYFIIADTKTGDFKVVDNESAENAGGAGVSTAQTIIDEEVSTVLTGKCGPNAYKALSNAGIRIITDVNCKVSEAIDNFKSGKYTESKEPNVEEHYGKNQ